MDEFSQFHYHGIRHTVRGFVGQNQMFCPYCGIYSSYGNSQHTCKTPQGKCRLCLRPEMTVELFDQVDTSAQPNFCPKNEIPKDEFQCSYCKQKTQSTMCLEIHQRLKCKKYPQCFKCQRFITLKGKYSLQKTEGVPVVCHENCEEIFCHICEDYVLGFDDPRNPTHTCYVPVVKKNKPWPSKIVAFDFETFPNDENGTMQLNLAHLITQKEQYEANSEFVGVFFSDIPMGDAVTLNGQPVKPGVEYTPNMGTDLYDYYPFELLKRAAAVAMQSLSEKEVEIMVSI